MEFHLVHHWNYASVLDDILQMMNLKIAHTDRFDEALFLQMNQSFPSLPILSCHRPMYEIQIYIVQPQLAPANFKRFQR
ncbi:hypothetical protein D3C71_1472620 [compost metagenome]